MIRLEDRSRRLTVDLQERDWTAYPVMDEELDMFASIYSSINQTFFGVALGIVFSIILALWTGGVREGSLTTYRVALGIAVVASFYLGLRVRADSQQAKARIERIRKRRPPELTWQ